MEFGKSHVGDKKDPEVTQVQVVGVDSEGQWEEMLFRLGVVFPSISWTRALWCGSLVGQKQFFSHLALNRILLTVSLCLLVIGAFFFFKCSLIAMPFY